MSAGLVTADIVVVFHTVAGPKSYVLASDKVEGAAESTVRLRQVATLMHQGAWDAEEMADEIDRERSE